MKVTVIGFCGRFGFWAHLSACASCGNFIVISPGEFQALLRYSDARFRRVLIVLRLTGCRPAELRSLIWEWVDLDNHLWILPEHKTVTRQRQPKPRMIPLPESSD